MKKKFTFLIAAVALLTMMVLPGKAVGQTRGFTTYYTLTCTYNSSNSAYANYNDVTINGISWNAPGNQAVTNGVNKWRIGGPKGTDVTRTIKSNGYIEHTISKVTLNHSGRSNDNLTINSISLIVASDASFSTIVETVTKNNPNVSSAGSLDFEPSAGGSWAANKYYKLTITYSYPNTSPKNVGLDITSLVFYKTTYTVTYNANNANSGTAPSAATYDAGANVTVAANSGSLEKTGYSFTGWNTDPDGEGTHYDAGSGTISAISADVTLYAEWTSTSTPSIVANGGTNSLGIACIATTTGTIPVAFNNMDGFTSEAISLYNDSGCTEAFSGGWLYDLSITGDPKNTINYKASENAGTARTVYMRVSASYNSTTYYSNVVAITQAAPTFTVTYNANGGSGTMTDSNSPYSYGSTVTTLTNAFTAPTGKVFDGWNTANDGSGTGYAAGATFTITANTTLYAQWADIPTYTLVTFTSDIIPGAHYVIVGRTNNGTWAMGAQTGSNTYRNADEITGGVVNNQVSQENLMEFVISGPVTSGNKSLYTIYDESQATNHFLNANGGTSSNTINVTSTIGNTSQWTIDFDNNKAVVTANFSGKNLLSFNSSASPKRFTCYGAEQTAIYLFKKDIDNNIHPYSSSVYSGNVTIKDNITLSSSNVITVADGGVLTLTGTVTNTDPANLIIEDGGQLVTNNAVQATVHKTIDGHDGSADAGWKFIASPIAGNTLPTNVGGMINSTTDNYDLYRFTQNPVIVDNDAKHWENYKAHTGDFNLTNGLGYLYANADGVDLIYTGTINPGTSSTYPVDLDYTEGTIEEGWNLIGNPFTCNATIDKSFYVISGHQANASTGLTTIAPCTGVMVMAERENDTVTFTKAPEAESSTVIRGMGVNLTGEEDAETIDNAIVSFNEGSELPKFYFGTQNANIYIPMDNEEFAIVSSNAQGEMPVNFRAYVAGEYTITVNPEEVEMGYLHLIDNIAGKDVDLLANPSYSFNARTDDYESRFRLVFSTTMVNAEMGEDFAFMSDGQLVIANEGEATLQVIDVTGRVVTTESINGTCSKAINAIAGVYVLRLINGNDVKTQKMVIR